MIRLARLLATLIIGVSTLTGCATLHPLVSVTKFGEVDTSGDKSINESAKKIVDTSDVKVISGSFPEGLTLVEQSSKIVVLPGYENKYDIIGEADADYLKALKPLQAVFWVGEYDEPWRRNLCYPQAPLKLLTFGLWGIFSPTAWPCSEKAPSEELDRKAALIDELKKGVKAAGGNLLVIAGSTSLTVNTYNQYGSHVNTSFTPMTGLKGFIVKEVR
jgi:hypothetical protein